MPQIQFSLIGRMLFQACSHFPAQAIAHPHHGKIPKIAAQIVSRFDAGHPMLAVETLGKRIDHILLPGQHLCRKPHFPMFGTPFTPREGLQSHPVEPGHRLTAQFIEQ